MWRNLFNLVFHVVVYFADIATDLGFTIALFSAEGLIPGCISLLIIIVSFYACADLEVGTFEKAKNPA